METVSLPEKKGVGFMLDTENFHSSDGWKKAIESCVEIKGVLTAVEEPLL